MAVQYAFGKIVTQGLDLNVDAADPTSYPGSGTSWTSVVNRSITGSLVSCSFSTDFKGGIVFNNPSASVIFPGTVANYGTGSFTIEMAFRPTQIQGIHYLVSKNSGSFPNWGVYLSGSGGSGKLFAEYNINASVSCSVSSSTVFVTGSNYFVDVQLQPGLSGSIIYNNGGIETGNLCNGGGSLTTTGSLFLGNITPSSSQAYSGSLFFTRVYLTEALTTAYSNYNPSKTRLQINVRPPILVRVLTVGGGGGAFGSGEPTAGGGAGGFVEQLVPLSLTPGTTTVFVGAGGLSTNGSSSYIDLAPTVLTAYGGGRSNTGTVGSSGGSGAGGAGNQVGGAGTVGQGFAGGSASGGFPFSGGGGGAGGTGSSVVNGSAGGPGRGSDISGVLTYYAGGGGGTNTPAAPGGIGGGGAGGLANSTFGTAGTPNTGGGGGGAGGASRRGAAGGSGIVIIRYPGPPIATGGTITSVDGDTIHTFTATGSSTFTVF
jgi:hypothetical protein